MATRNATRRSRSWLCVVAAVVSAAVSAVILPFHAHETSHTGPGDAGCSGRVVSSSLDVSLAAASSDRVLCADDAGVYYLNDGAAVRHEMDRNVKSKRVINSRQGRIKGENIPPSSESLQRHQREYNEGVLETHVFHVLQPLAWARLGTFHALQNQQKGIRQLKKCISLRYRTSFGPSQETRTASTKIKGDKTSHASHSPSPAGGHRPYHPYHLYHPTRCPALPLPAATSSPSPARGCTPRWGCGLSTPTAGSGRARRPSG